MPVYLGVPALCLPQDVLSTVPEQNAAGQLEDLSGGCLLLRARRCWLRWLMHAVMLRFHRHASVNRNASVNMLIVLIV
jgi:hypothetical protein